MTEGFEVGSQHLRILVLGQINHGKTTLSAAITGVLSEKDMARKIDLASIDEMSQELERYFIHIARLEYRTDNRSYTLMDCPNHEDHLKHLLASEDEINGAILVVAATDGIMPQAKEQIRMARQIGIQKIVVFLNKVDVVNDAERLKVVETDISAALAIYGFGDSPIVRGSALGGLKGESPWTSAIDKLIETVDLHIPSPVRDKDKPFLLSIKEVTTIVGRGIVTTGYIETGVVKINDEVVIVTQKGDVESVVTGVEICGRVFKVGEAGERVGLWLNSTDRSSIRTGDTVILPKNRLLHPSYTKFKAEIYILSKEENGRRTPFFKDYQPQFLFRASEITGSLTLPEGVEKVEPGSHLAVTVTLTNPTILHKGLRFEIRERVRLIGVGLITEIIE